MEQNLIGLLPTPALLLSTEGVVLAISEGWPPFMARLKRGDNFADACRNASTSEIGAAARLAGGVEAIIAGQESLLFSGYSAAHFDGTPSLSMPAVLLRAYAGGVLIMGVENEQASPAPGTDITATIASLSPFPSSTTTPNTSSRDVAGEVTRAREEERKRIARELHDDLGQRLAAHAMAIGNLRRNLPQDRVALLNRLITLENDAVELGGSVRLLAHELHTAHLERNGLVASLRVLATEFCEWTGLNLTLELQELPCPISNLAAVPLYRIAQEALHNVERHARATALKLSLSCDPKTLTLVIEDNGRGFDPLHLKKEKGLGLAGIEDRAHSLNGELTIQSSPNRGTRMTVRVPLSALSL